MRQKTSDVDVWLGDPVTYELDLSDVQVIKALRRRWRAVDGEMGDDQLCAGLRGLMVELSV